MTDRRGRGFSDVGGKLTHILTVRCWRFEGLIHPLFVSFSADLLKKTRDSSGTKMGH